MNTLSSTPFLRILLPFASGIIFYVFTPVNIEDLVPTLIFPISIFVLILSSISIWSKKLSKNYKIRWIWGLLLYLLLFMSGITYTYSGKENHRKNHYTHHLNQASHLRLKIIEAPVQKEEYMKAMVEVQALLIKEKWEKTIGKALIKVEADSLSRLLKYGDCLITANEFKEITSLQNPGESNFSTYLFYKNIYRQAYLSGGSWIFTKENDANPLVDYAYHLRNSLIDIFRKYIIGKEEVAVASALLIGYTDEIDNTLRKAYSVAGVMHVLSVSGMHVGIIYLLLAQLLFFLERNRWMRILKSIILISFLWFYALLTGLSPAVLRAALMLSMVILGKAIHRESNLMNILLAAAFLLMITDPFILLSIGFQLSFLAVAGIVLFQEWIYNWIQFKNKYWDKIWKLTAVSLAAQLSTFPLGIYYFKQFPNYFIIANMIVIPLATIVMYACMGLLVLSPIKAIAIYAGKICYYLVYLLNQSVIITEKLPASVSNGFSIDIIETLLIYSLIFFIFMYSQKPYAQRLMGGLIVIFGLLFSNSYSHYVSKHQKKLIVYNIRKSSAIDFIYGEENLLLSDSALFWDPDKNLRSISPGHDMMNIKKTNSEWVHKNEIFSLNIKNNNFVNIKNNFIYFSKQKIFILNNNKILKSKNTDKIKLDYLIISGNISCKIKDILAKFSCKKIIIDSGNAPFKTRKWMKECEENKIYCFSVALSGPFIQSF